MGLEALAHALAERLNAVLPPGLSLLVTREAPHGFASGSELWLAFDEHGEVVTWAEVEDYPDWLEHFLHEFQDWMGESTRQPWPATIEQARGKREPFPDTIIDRGSDGIRVSFVYRETGERILELRPIPLTDLAD